MGPPERRGGGQILRDDRWEGDRRRWIPGATAGSTGGARCSSRAGGGVAGEASRRCRCCRAVARRADRGGAAEPEAGPVARWRSGIEVERRSAEGVEAEAPLGALATLLGVAGVALGVVIRAASFGVRRVVVAGRPGLAARCLVCVQWRQRRALAENVAVLVVARRAEGASIESKGKGEGEGEQKDAQGALEDRLVCEQRRLQRS